MQTVTVFNAKTHFSGIIMQIITGQEDEFIISRHGKPVAKIVPINNTSRIIFGLAEGEFEIGDDNEETNKQIANDFLGL